MPIKPLMTYVAGRKGWMKSYRGKSYAVSCRQLGVPESKGGSVLAANCWWTAKQGEVDAADRPDPIRAAAERVGETLEGLDLDSLRGLVEKGSAARLLLAAAGEHRDGGKGAVWTELNGGGISRAVNVLAPDAAPDRSVGRQRDEWLALLAAGQMKPPTLRYYRFSVARFVDWIGPAADVGAITPQKYEQFFHHLGGRVAEGKAAQATAAETMKVARQFVGRLAELGLIVPPGNLHSRRLKFGVPPKRVQVVPDEEVKALLAACTGARAKTKAYVLLMLNCGMYQTDLAELRAAEVDWRAGTVTRERSKRRDHGGPVVSYQLWPETLEELRRWREGSGDLVFRTRHGRPLVARWNEAGKMRSYDCVKSAWLAACRAAGVEDRPLKLLRKTAASKLATHPQYKYYAGYFLAHAPRSVAERHYVKPNEEEFRAALGWLREQFL